MLESSFYTDHLVNFKYQSSCVTPSVWSRVPNKSSASSRAPRAGESRRTEGPLRYWRRPEVVPRWPGSAAGHGGDARDGDGDSCRCKSLPCWAAPCSAPGNRGCKMRGLTVPSRSLDSRCRWPSDRMCRTSEWAAGLTTTSCS